MISGLQPAGEAVVPAVTEEENALWLSARGLRVVETHGRYWRVDQGRWQPTHFFAHLPAADIRRPGRACWAYRAAVLAGEESEANGAIPMHVVQDLEAYSLEGLRSSKRRQIRASMRRLQFVAIKEPDLLAQQGLRVLESAVERHGYGSIRSKSRYQKELEAYFQRDGGLVIGALDGDRLVGYVTVHASGATAYVEDVHLASDALETQVGPGLTFHAAMAAQRSPQISELVHSLVTPERPGLLRFKEQMGFPIVEVPARYWIAPGLEQLLRRLRPNAYYRFTGKRIPVEVS